MRLSSKIAAVAGVAALAAGCGGEDPDSYPVEFDRPSAPETGAAVYLEGENVGEVGEVVEERRRFGDPIALATLELDPGTQLPDSTGAITRDDGSVALVPGPASTRPLAVGSRIPVARTSRCPRDLTRIRSEFARACR